MTVYVRSYKNLWLSCFTQESHDNSCGYWYAVRVSHAPHTAFATAERLGEWLAHRGLTLEQPIPAERGTWAYFPIRGAYFDASHRDVSVFEEIEPLFCLPVLSNAEYTLGKITEDESGVRTLHYLNVNDREGVFPWPRRSWVRPRRTVLLEDQRAAVLDYITAQGLPTFGEVA